MREMLEPIFGATGAVAAQFVITLIVILALVVVVFWLVRRYAGARFGGIARGRVPRLAIVDAMAIDRRRRLVLVRRDNAEHLILIGGPSDLLVEGPIRRVSARQRAEYQLAAARASEPPAEAAMGPEAVHIDEAEAIAPPEDLPALEPGPVRTRPAATAAPTAPAAEAPQPAPPPPAPPFPPRRSAAAGGVAGGAAAPSMQAGPDPAPFRPRHDSAAVPEVANDHPADAASARFAETAHPTEVRQIGRADASPGVAGAPTATGDDLVARSALGPSGEFADAEETEDDRQAPLDLGDSGAPPAADRDIADAEANPRDDTAAKVSDLEREMAKLLGGIGTERAT
jgi:flagellar protein FliO/FliZ